MVNQPWRLKQTIQDDSILNSHYLSQKNLRDGDDGGGGDDDDDDDNDENALAYLYKDCWHQICQKQGD